jgi:hypothetical protein
MTDPMNDPTTDQIPTRPVGPHPTPEQLYAARHGQDEGSRALLRHAAGCAACSEEMARQEAFDQPEALPAAALEAAWERFGQEQPHSRTSRTPRTPSRTARWTPVLALAAALTACVLGLGLWMTRTEPQPGPADVERGAPVVPGLAADWHPSGLLAAPPAELTFPNPQGETRRVRVFDASQGYTWTSAPTEGGRVLFPEAERRRLKPGVEYFWTVLGGDEPNEGNAARSFRIRP